MGGGKHPSVVVVLLVLAVLLSACNQPNSNLGLIVVKPSHTHVFPSEPSSYRLSGSTLQGIYICSECGSEKSVTISQNADVVSGDVSEAFEEGSTIIVSPETAQSALDCVVDGMTVYFGPGEYGELEIGHSKAVSTVYKSIDGEVLAEPIDFAELNNTSAYHYSRTLKDVSFIADPAARFTGPITMASAHVFGTADSTACDPIRDIELTGTSPSFYSHISMDGVVFSNMHFTGNGRIGFSYTSGISADKAKDLTFRNCIFEGNGAASENGQALRLYGQGTMAYENVVFENLEISKYYHGIIIWNFDGVSVAGCHINDVGFNAVQLSGVKATTDTDGIDYFTGNVTISCNEMSNCGDRAIRISAGKDASIVVTENDIRNATDASGEYFKASGMSDCTLHFSDNAYDGAPVEDYSGGSSEWADGTITFG